MQEKIIPIPRAALGVSEDGKQFMVTLRFGYDSSGPTEASLRKTEEFLGNSGVLEGKGMDICLIRSNIDDVTIYGGNREAVILARDYLAEKEGHVIEMIPGASYSPGRRKPADRQPARPTS